MKGFYTTIEELPLYKFDKYLQSKDVNWFRKTYTGQEKKIKPSQAHSDLEFEILDQYYKAVDDKAFIEKLQKWAKIQVLRTKYVVCINLVQRIYVGFHDEETRFKFIDALASHGYKISKINNRAGEVEELQVALQQIEGIKNQIHILEEQLQEEGRKESHNLTKQIKFVELNLGAKYHHQIKINPKETSVAEWIEYQKELKELVEQN